ncbi:transglutaminase family protein [Streptomyces kaempferi]
MAENTGAAAAAGTATETATLAATEFLDHRSPTVRAFVDKTLARAKESDTATQKATALYYAVRDGITYEVYGADLTRHGLSATGVLEKGFGFCVHKSILYAAALRAVGIPSRVYYGDVRNHLASPRLRELVGGDVFRFHSLTVVNLDDRWVKATPVFNKLLSALQDQAAGLRRPHRQPVPPVRRGRPPAHGVHPRARLLRRRPLRPGGRRDQAGAPAAVRERPHHRLRIAGRRGRDRDGLRRRPVRPHPVSPAGRPHRTAPAPTHAHAHPQERRSPCRQRQESSTTSPDTPSTPAGRTRCTAAVPEDTWYCRAPT